MAPHILILKSKQIHLIDDASYLQLSIHNLCFHLKKAASFSFTLSNFHPECWVMHWLKSMLISLSTSNTLGVLLSVESC